MKIIHVVGARPNFMKIAPIIEAFEKFSKNHKIALTQRLVHTGQHYSREMSSLLFEELNLPRPDINLEIGSGSHGAQTGRIMEAFEKVLIDEKPDAVLVVGDVNSTIACALDAKKMGITVIHVEAGLRSGDTQMPEEINRVLTDAISDLLFTTEQSAKSNLLKEGIAEEKIFFTGNVMIDTLLQHRKKAEQLDTLEKYGLKRSCYAVLTLHRPSNVDSKSVLSGIGEAITEIAKDLPVIFPIHPRTRQKLIEFKLDSVFCESNGIRLLEPQGYLSFMNLMANAKLVLSDSGGIQEETTALQVPCLTLRNNTERPITIEQGSNQLVGVLPEAILTAYRAIDNTRGDTNKIPPLWDGQAAERTVEVIMKNMTSSKKNKQQNS